MNFFKLRTTHKVVSFTDTLPVIRSLCEVYAYCHEGGDTNPHCHWYLETSRQMPAIRARLRKLQEGNRFYSIKTLDEQYPLDYLAYMMKEGDFHFDRLPPEVIEDVKARQEEVKNGILDKKQNRRRVIDILFDLVTETYPNAEFDSDSYSKLIIPIVVDYHLEKNITIRPGQIEAYVLTILLKKSAKQKAHYMKAVYDKVYRTLNPL